MKSPENPLDLESLRLERGETELRYIRSRRRRNLMFFSLIILVVVSGVWWVWSGALWGQKVAVTTVLKIYPSQAVTLLNASGYVVAQRKASVSSKSTGRLSYLGIEEGSRVQQGEIIARLENDDLNAARDRAAFNVKASTATLEQAQAELTDARLNYVRQEKLLAQNLISRQDFDAAEARYRKAVAAVANAQATIKAAVAALAEAQTAVEYSFIRAPFNGVVLTKNAEVGEVVAPFGAAANARAAVATMADMDSLMVEVDVSEANINQVKVDQPCEILLDALPGERFSGKVHMIVPTADRSKATIMVKVAFDEMDPRILPEMSAKAAFLSRSLRPEEQQLRLVVHSEALVQQDGRSTAFVLKENRVEVVSVEVGPKMGDLVEIRAGLREGNKVVLRPPKNLASGDRVQVQEG
ncbi:MAG TPA: efflux RND transporter periplasmic adaptor subunit [Desulfobacterales bacterium]|nr:efflux RND transporter periplasmic adaptor subunit [Desulfobacterales bacterium]